MNRLELLGVKVKREYLLFLYEYQLVRVTISIYILEMVLHAYLIKEWDVFDNDSFDQLKLVVRIVALGSLPLENEKLVLLLLIFD